MNRVSDILWGIFKTILWIAFGLIALFVMLISHGPSQNNYKH